MVLDLIFFFDFKGRKVALHEYKMIKNFSFVKNTLFSEKKIEFFDF